MISANAGPSQMAGELCHKNFFSTSWQNDQTPMALGEVLNQRGVNSFYIMSPNYAAGKNMAAGVERTFKGEIKGKDMTKWGKDAQLNFSAELAKAKASGTEAIFVFYPGKAGGAFIKLTLERLWEAELHRFKGQLLLESDTANAAEAEVCYQKALKTTDLGNFAPRPASRSSGTTRIVWHRSVISSLLSTAGLRMASDTAELN